MYCSATGQTSEIALDYSFFILGVAVILGGGFVNFGKSGGFITSPERIPTSGLQHGT